MRHRPRMVLGAAVAVIALGSAALGGQQFPLSIPTSNRSGLAQTLVAGRTVDRDEPFFQRLGYRARSVGWQELGTRIYIEARTVPQIDDIVSVAQRAGFVGPYPSRWVIF